MIKDLNLPKNHSTNLKTAIYLELINTQNDKNKIQAPKCLDFPTNHRTDVSYHLTDVRGNMMRDPLFYHLES